MDKMSKPNWACPICGEDFTRKFSALRHNNNIHKGRCLPVRYIDYLAGRRSGLYLPPLTPTRLLGSRTKMKFNHRNNQLADSTRGDFSYTNSTESEYIGERSFTRGTNQVDHITETINRLLKYRTFQRAYNQLSQPQNMLVPSMNFNTLPTDIGIVKPIGFQAYVCDLCLSGPIEAVSKFVEHGSLRKVNHKCNPEVLMRAKHLTEDEREGRHDVLFQFLAGLVNEWIGQDEIYLKSEELSPMESYRFGTDADRPSYVEDCIDLGYLRENHWAERAIKAPEVAKIDKSELMDYLSIAKATFAVFRVKLANGTRRYFFMYISTGLESSKVNHLQELANSNNNNNNNNTSAQPDWHDVIQFVVAGNSRIPVLRWDKLESIGIVNLLRQAQDCLKNERSYC